MQSQQELDDCERIPITGDAQLLQNDAIQHWDAGNSTTSISGARALNQTKPSPYPITHLSEETKIFYKAGDSLFTILLLLVQVLWEL